MGGRTVAGTYMAVAVNFQAAYPLAIGGWTFRAYTALYTLILNWRLPSC